MICKSLNSYTPKDFERYYSRFLGIDNFDSNKESLIISSKLRDYSINSDFYYPVIVSKFYNRIICSVSPKYFNDIFLLCNNKICFKNINSIFFEYFSQKKINFEIKTMNRMVKFDDLKIGSNAILLKNNMKKYFLDSFSNNVTQEQKLKKWEKVKKNIKNTCYSCFLKDDKIISTSFISDVFFGGGNIIVFTKKENRFNGYGKQCLVRCINWCFCNNILPIYFVDIKNSNSINLAKSLGFDTMSEELVVLLK